MSGLYPFQRAGASWLAHRRRAYLADEMGLGKTVQAIHAAGNVPGSKYTIVAPASLRENWRREWKTWWPGFPTEPAIVSYTRLSMMGDTTRELNNFHRSDVVIFDEAHYMKTPSANRTRAGLRLARHVYRNGGRVWFLSASPTPNDPSELWPILKVIWPDLLPVTTKQDFIDRYCYYTMGEWGPKIWGLRPAAHEELAPVLRSAMLRRKLSDVALQLPPLRFTLEHLPHDAGVEQKIAAMAAPKDDPSLLATTRRLLGQYKAPKVAATLAAELKSEGMEAVVVMYHHHVVGDALRAKLYHLGVLGFDGDTPMSDRQDAIDRFQAGEGRVFLVQQQAGGVGITLTRANEIVLAEPSWSPADNVQAIKRIHRIGQDKPCRARIFAMPGTMDEGLMDTLMRKNEMVKGVLGE